MTTEERHIEVSSVAMKMGPRNSRGDITIYYGWHPDSGEVVVSVKTGTARPDEFAKQLPEGEWRTLDFEDPDLVDALFSGNHDLQVIEKLISEKDTSIGMALIQYIHWITGRAL